jgi:hypothetical protein
MYTLGKEFPSYSTVKKWAAEFKRDRESIGDDKGPGSQKKQPTMKLPKLCTIWSCATEGEICEALLGKWV